MYVFNDFDFTLNKKRLFKRLYNIKNLPGEKGEDYK